MGLNQRDRKSMAELNLTAAIQIDDREALELIRTEGNIPMDLGNVDDVTAAETAPLVEADSVDEELEDREEPQSDADVTHTEEDDDPEENVGEEVDYDLGPDTDD